MKKTTVFIVSLIVFVLWIAFILAGPKLQFGSEKISHDQLISNTVVYSLALAPALLLIVVAIFGWWKETGLAGLGSSKEYKIALLPVLFILVFFGAALFVGLPPASVIFFVGLNTLFVGIHEELMCRGILFNGAFSVMSVWPAILLTCLLFGGIHALNGFTTGDFLNASLQAVAAGMSGLWFLALRLRIGSIIPSMVLHWLWDFGLFLAGAGAKVSNPDTPSVEVSAGSKATFAIMFAAPLFLYALFLLRKIGKKSREEILYGPGASEAAA